MFKKDQIVVYRLNVCRVDDILKNYRNNEDYYELRGVHDTSLTIKTPVKLADTCARQVISGDVAQGLVDDITTFDDITTDSETIQRVCDDHLKKGVHKDLLRIVKTNYAQKHYDTSKPYSKWSERDKSAFRNAEKVLYREIGAALGKSAEKARRSIYDQLNATAPAVA